MSAGVDVDEEKAILSRLLGSGLSTEGIAAALQGLLTMIRAELAALPAQDDTVWMPAKSLAKRYDCDEKYIHTLIRQANARKPIRVWMPVSEEGKPGKTRYNVRDMDEVFLVEKKHEL